MNRRQLLTALLLFGSLIPAASAQQSLGDRIANWLESKRGVRLGCGGCSNLATEALRANGGKFIRNDNGAPYPVWSDQLVTQINGTATGAAWTNPTAQIRRGDVLQLTNVRFTNSTITTARHTAVVASVNAQGRIAEVYDQNITLTYNGTTTVVKHVLRRTKNYDNLISGFIRVYRPSLRVPQSGRFEYTIVNNTPGVVTVSEKVGTSNQTYTLDPVLATMSYRNRTRTTTTALSPVLKVGTSQITVQDGAGYEVYKTPSGALALRKLPW